MASKNAIVQELEKYLCDNPDFNAAFEKSFKKARDEHPTLVLWTKFKVDSVKDYIRYMDEFVHWVPTENRDGTDVYDHLCFFYFILDISPIHEYQSLIHPSSSSPWTWLSQWLIKYAQEMGRWMDMTASFDPDLEQFKNFIESPVYRDKDVDDFYHQYPRPLGGWKTFNEFFARSINADLRPIAGLEPDEDSSIIVCPADCAFDKPCEFPVNTESTVELKGIPWSIRQLLDEGSDDHHSSKFSGGVFTHAFLNTTNYHRLHAPVSGEVVEAKIIPGLCYLEVEVQQNKDDTPDGPIREHLSMRRRMTPPETIAVSSQDGGQKPDAPNSPGYQFLQARALILIKSKIGLVAVLPIGMAQVSSVVLSVKVGDKVKKGHEIAFFQLGGSDVVMVFEKDAKVQLNPENSNGEVFTKVGSKIGTATPFLHG